MMEAIAVETKSVTEEEKIPALYNITEAKIAELRSRFSGLKINGVEDKPGYELVRTAKSEMVGLRNRVEDRRKELKAESVEYGRKVDAAAKKITAELEVIEEELTVEKERIDKEIKDAKDKRQNEINERCKRRVEALTAVNALATVRYENIPGMDEDDFQDHLVLVTAKFNEEKRIQAEKDAELERLRKADEEAKAKEAAALETQRKEMAEKQAAMDKQREAQEAKEAVLKAEADRLEREKREAEEKVRKEAEAKRHAEEIEAAKVEAARKATADAEAKAKADADAKIKREADEKSKADAAAARKAARMNDKEKITAYVKSIQALPLPELKDQASKDAMDDFSHALKVLFESV